MANFCRWCAGLCGFIVIAAAVAGGVLYLMYGYGNDNDTQQVPFNATVIQTLTTNNELQHNNTNPTNTEQGIHGWNVDSEIAKNCSYYWAGADKEGRPVWFFDYSNCFIEEIVKRSLQTPFENYIAQMIFRVNCSMTKSGTSDWALVSDMGGDLKAGLNIFGYMNDLFNKFKCFSDKMSYGLIFNSDNSFVAKAALGMIRIIIPAAADRTIFLYDDTPKSEIESEVTQRISPKELPLNYGGVERFVPHVSYKDMKRLDCPDVPDFMEKLNECKSN